MKKHILLLRLSYWIAALADFAIAYWALVPKMMGVNTIVYPMGLLSVIAFSWGVLLIFADRKPVERRWILIPTSLVVALLTIVRIVFSVKGYIEFSLGFLLFGLGLLVLLVVSYILASRK